MTEGLQNERKPTEFLPIIAVSMIVMHTLLRGWQALGGWFYSDDFIFLEDALNAPFGAELLLTPHDSQLMPVGVAISWVVAHAGVYSWGTAAAIMVGLQFVAAVSCYVALRTLFGNRPAILVPLGFYLFAAMSPEAFHWWAAALNAVPMQIAFFGLVIGMTRWTRSPGWANAAIAVGSLALAALSGPRGLVMTVPVALLVVLFLTQGRLRSRPLTIVKRDWPILLPLALVSIGYLVLYRETTPSPVEGSGSAPAGAILANLIGKSWLPSLVGGPWRWNENNPPMSQPDPPVVLLVAAAAVVGLLVLWSLKRNPKATAAALIILTAQLSITYIALVFGRGLQLGASAGLMTRYLTDTLPVTALCIGLATIPLQSSSGVTAPRPWRLGPIRQRALGGLGAAALVGAVVSTVLYSANWHADYPARAFVQTAGAELTTDPAPIADVEVPELVQSPLSYPNNLPSQLLRPYGDLVTAVDRGNDLQILDDDGKVKSAALRVTAASESGPIEGCGYRIDDETTATISVPRDDVHVFWWLGAGYLASADGEIELSVYGQKPVRMQVYQGLHTYLLKGEDQFGSVRMRSLTPGLTVCVDRIDVGDLVDF